MTLYVALSDQAEMELLLHKLKLSGLNAKMYKTNLTAKMLSQSIESWLTELGKHHYYDKLKDKKCSTFEALFKVHGNPKLFSLVTSYVGMDEIDAMMFSEDVKAKQDKMLGSA